MRNEFRQPDEQNMRQLLHQHPEDLPGLILRLAWLQGLSREEIVALKWAQVDFQERSLFLEDRTVPLEEETAGCLAARFENGGAVAPSFFEGAGISLLIRSRRNCRSSSSLSMSWRIL